MDHSNPTMWVNFGLAALTLFLGTAIQAVLFAFFLGKMKGANTALESTVKAMSRSIEEMQGQRLASALTDGGNDVRIAVLEKGMEGIGRMEREFIAFRATAHFSRHVGNCKHVYIRRTK